jgi:hypothetical protein
MSALPAMAAYLLYPNQPALFYTTAFEKAEFNLKKACNS